MLHIASAPIKMLKLTNAVSIDCEQKMRNNFSCKTNRCGLVKPTAVGNIWGLEQIIGGGGVVQTYKRQITLQTMNSASSSAFVIGKRREPKKV